MRATLLFLWLPSVAPKPDYCAISKQHTMCGYQGLGPKCGGRDLGRKVTEEEKRIILDTHNKYRAKIASGNEKRGRPGPQPPAANMKQMVWDDELSLVAQAHADQCIFDHDCASCRKVERWGVGQNLYIYKQSIRKADNDWERAVTDWYDEVSLFSNKQVEPFKFSAAIGHYSQMVWADTDKVGCGITSYKEGKWFATLYTCNYGPNGNFIRGQMYSQGRACSQCPDNTSCSSQYPGLCTLGSQAPPTFNKPTITTTTTKMTTRASSTTRIRSTASTTTKATLATRVTTTTRATTKTKSKSTRATTTTKYKSTTTLRPQTKQKKTVIPPNFLSLNGTANSSLLQDKSKLGKTSLVNKPSFVKNKRDQLLFDCDFEEAKDECEMRTNGVEWDRVDDLSNSYYETQLFYNDKTELFFNNLIDSPRRGIVCLEFKYKKHSKFGRKSSLSVVAWPYRGKPGRISVFKDSPDPSKWVKAQITFRKVDNNFLLMFRGGGPSTTKDNLHLAVDQIKITPGKCRRKD